MIREDKQSKSGPVIIERFESVAEAVRVCTPNAFNGDDHWCAGTTQETTQKLLHGDNALVAKSEGFSDKITDFDMPGTYGIERHRDVFGSSLSMGDYVTGSPTPFRRGVRRVSDTSPIRVIVGITTSAIIDAKDQQARGCAVLTLIQKIQAVRPVELYVLSELGGTEECSIFSIIEINTRPLDLATSVVALSHVGLPRKFIQGRVESALHAGYHGQWPGGYKSNDKTYDKFRRESLSLTDTDITIDSLYAEDPYLKDPIGWVNNQMKQLQERIGQELETA